MFGGNSSSGSGDITYLVSHVTSQEHVIEGSRLDYLTMFGGHIRCVSVNKMLLVCHVTF